MLKIIKKIRISEMSHQVKAPATISGNLRSIHKILMVEKVN